MARLTSAWDLVRKPLAPAWMRIAASREAISRRLERSKASVVGGPYEKGEQAEISEIYDTYDTYH
jgi:hypothetical protein